MSDVESAKREEREARVQRISFQGMAATTSTLAALVVALTSAFTAIRAFALSESAAQQRVFERQLDACLELNTLVSHVAANNSQIAGVLGLPQGDMVTATAGPGEPAPTVAERSGVEELDARLNTMLSQNQQLDREILRLNMLLPSQDASNKILAAYEKQNNAYNIIVEARNAGNVPAPVVQRVTGIFDQTFEDLNQATGLCQEYVSSMVSRGTLG